MIDSTGLDLQFDVEGPSGRAGLAIVLPGFLDSADYDASVYLAEKLVEYKFTTVRLDLRGSWRNGATLEDYRTSVHVEDVRRLVASATHPRVVVAGYCYGASVAAVAASLDTRITDVVALMPTRYFVRADDGEVEPGDWRDAVDHDFVRHDPHTHARTTLRVPYTAVEDAQQHDLGEALSRLSCRILFVAGQRDGIAVPDHVRQLHDGCSSPDKRLAVLGVEHDYRETQSEIDLVNDTVAEWLA